jgi:SAM-dependent methyltransferase
MAIICPIGFDVARLRAAVHETYDRLARAPDGEFHFHRGLEYAVRQLGYDRAELEGLPPAAVARFAGVGNPLRLGPVHPGETVLDHACGAGVDLLLAARRAGAGGRAIGVDMTPSMRQAAAKFARDAALAEVVDVRAGFLEELPVESGSVDVVVSNGVVNLSPDKPRVFREIARVLRPGGRLYLADVIVARELSLGVREDPGLWAACIGGALREPELFELAASVGLEDARIMERFDPFAGTTAGARVAPDLRVHAVGLRASRSSR